MRAPIASFPDQLRAALKSLNPNNPERVIPALRGATALEKYQSLRTRVEAFKHGMAIGLVMSLFMVFAMVGGGVSFPMVGWQAVFKVLFFVMIPLVALHGCGVFWQRLNERRQSLIIKQALFLSLTPLERQRIQQEEVTRYKAIRVGSVLVLLVLAGVFTAAGMLMATSSLLISLDLVFIAPIILVPLAMLSLAWFLPGILFNEAAVPNDPNLNNPELIAELPQILALPALPQPAAAGVPVAPQPAVAAAPMRAPLPAVVNPERQPLLPREEGAGAAARRAGGGEAAARGEGAVASMLNPEVAEGAGAALRA